MWTPINKPPKEEGWYLVTSTKYGTPYVNIAFYFGGTWRDEYRKIFNRQCIRAWMPLPEPYKEPNKYNYCPNCGAKMEDVG